METPTARANTIVGPKIDPGANYSDQYIVISGFDGKTFDWDFTALGNLTYDMAIVIVQGRPELGCLHVRLHGESCVRRR